MTASQPLPLLLARSRYCSPAHTVQLRIGPALEASQGRLGTGCLDNLLAAHSWLPLLNRNSRADTVSSNASFPSEILNSSKEPRGPVQGTGDGEVFLRGASLPALSWNSGTGQVSSFDRLFLLYSSLAEHSI